MTLYKAYLIYIALSFLSFAGAFAARKLRKKERQISRYEKLIINVIICVIAYYLIKVVFGWRFNWYAEAAIMLSTCVYFDYLIIVQKQFSRKLKDIYYAARLLLLGIPIASFVIIFFIGGLTLTFGFAFGCFIFPTDRTYGEQQVYKNLYIYKNECKDGFSFKKKFLFFEKDIVTFKGNYSSYFVGNPTLHDKITGNIEKHGDTIFISGKESRTKYRKYIRVLILKNDQLLIQIIRPLGHALDSEAIDVVRTEVIKI